MKLLTNRFTFIVIPYLFMCFEIKKKKKTVQNLIQNLN